MRIDLADFTPHGPSLLRRRWAVILLLSLLAAGCGKDKGMSNDSEKKLIEAAKPYLGIYQITASTRNDKGCEGEGESILNKDSDGYVVMSLAPGLLGKVLQVASCKDVPQCKEYAKKWGGGDFMVSFGDVSGKALTGVEFFTGFSSKDKTCEKGSTAALTLQKDGPGIRIEKRAVLVSYPADEKGFCSTTEVKKHAKGKPCSQLSVIRAKRVSDL